MRDAEGFVDHFAIIWASPQDHLDTFLDNLDPGIRLTAPIVGSSAGREAGYRAFRSAFAALPDLRGHVSAWSACGDTLYIDMVFTATIGRRQVSWPNIDRFTFQGEVAVERRAFFDPLELLPSFLRSPAGWRQLWCLARQSRSH
jgi:hypothetical protein